MAGGPFALGIDCCPAPQGRSERHPGKDYELISPGSQGLGTCEGICRAGGAGFSGLLEGDASPPPSEALPRGQAVSVI